MVQRQGEIYSALPLHRIARNIGYEPDMVSAIHADVQDMVRKGWLHATIVPPPSGDAREVTGEWVVNFDSFGGDSYSSLASINVLEDKIKTAKQWQVLLQQRDRELEKSTTYLARGLRTRDSRAAGGADAYPGGDDFDEGDY